MIVVSDTAPINYLVVIGHSELLTKLYGDVVVPLAVLQELLSEKAPEPVRKWVETRPTWLVVQHVAVEARSDCARPAAQCWSCAH